MPDWVNFVREPTSYAVAATSGLVRGDYLTGQPTVFDSALFAMRVRYIPRNVRKRYFHGFADAAFDSFNVGGGSVNDPAGLSGISCSSTVQGSPFVPTPTPINFAAATGYDVQSLSREFIWAFSVDGNTGAMHTAIYEYGWQYWTSGYVPGGVNEDVPTLYPTPSMVLDCNRWHVGGSNYGLSGQVAFMWWRASNDSASFVDLTVEANRRMLESNPETWTFETPLVWFQGKAAEWNAGTNRGTGGNFTMNAPGVTDVPGVYAL